MAMNRVAIIRELTVSSIHHHGEIHEFQTTSLSVSSVTFLYICIYTVVLLYAHFWQFNIILAFHIDCITLPFWNEEVHHRQSGPPNSLWLPEFPHQSNNIKLIHCIYGVFIIHVAWTLNYTKEAHRPHHSLLLYSSTTEIVCNLYSNEIVCNLYSHEHF
jgi:hypothetical protein